jgi:hypothetical protein
VTEERLCVLCAVRNRRPVHYERAQACLPCRIWLAETIADVAVLYPQLHAMLIPGQGNGQRVSGSREMPLPLNADIVDLTGPAKVVNLTDAGRPWWHEDQTGHVAVAAVLDQWVRDWISYDWCRSDVMPVPTVPELAAWLGKWAEAACDEHPAIDDFAGEIRDIHTAMRAYIPRVVDRDNPPPRRRAEPRTAPCRGCDMVSLWWFPSDERVRCDNCDVVMTESEYAAWARLIIAGERARLA